MIALSPRTTFFLSLCNTSTHTCDKKHKLSCLWLQDHPWKFRSSAPLMTREGSNFYNTGFWDSSRNNTDRRHERAFWVETLDLQKRHTLLSLKSFIKIWLEFPLYTRRIRSETLIFNRFELLFELNSNSANTTLNRSSLFFDRSN